MGNKDGNMKEKFLFTIQEASDYFNIGEVKLRQFINKHQDDNWWLSVGKRKMIKREMFEDYLRTLKTI